MTKTRFLVVLTSIAALITGCKEDAPAKPDLGYGYYPTGIGHWVEYHVDSLASRNDSTRSWSYEIREVLTEAFTDLEGRPAQRIIRYVKDSANQWLPKDVWWQTRETVRAERSEEDRRRVKLVFPPRYDTFWNTNARNATEEFELNYETIDEAWGANGLSFDSTLLVVGTYDPNIIHTKNYQERYAKNVGLVHRLVDSSETQIGQETYYTRHRVEYTITAFGQ